MDQCAICQRDLEAKNIVTRDAVFEAAWASGVSGNVAPQRAIRATGRVRRIIEPAALDRLLQFCSQDSRFDDGHEVSCADLFDTTHPLQREYQTAAVRDATA